MPPAEAGGIAFHIEGLPSPARPFALHHDSIGV